MRTLQAAYLHFYYCTNRKQFKVNTSGRAARRLPIAGVTQQGNMELGTPPVLAGRVIFSENRKV
jgi:hypothetical protein